MLYHFYLGEAIIDYYNTADDIGKKLAAKRLQYHDGTIRNILTELALRRQKTALHAYNLSYWYITNDTPIHPGVLLGVAGVMGWHYVCTGGRKWPEPAQLL